MKLNWVHNLDDAGSTPLIRASRSGRPDVATLMLVQEAHDQMDAFSALPALHRAACWGFHDVIAELAATGSDIDETDGQGETALHKAVRLGNVDAVRTLLDCGAGVNVADTIGMTALHWATLTGSYEMVELLLQHGANVDARDYYAGGVTPKRIARMLGHTRLLTAMEQRFAII
jgi:hypothetical protein